MNRCLFILLSLALPACIFANDEKIQVSATLESATVYRTSAELTHHASAILKSGTNDLVIEGLSNSLDLNSVQIASGNKLTILSLEFAPDYLRPVTKTPATKRLEDSLEIISKNLAAIQTMITTDKELIDLLKSNRELKGTQAGLSVTELMKLMDYYKSKTLETQSDLSLNREKERRLSESIDRLNQQIQEQDHKNTSSTGTLLLQVLANTAGTYNFSISYLTGKAFWTPSYDLHVEKITKPMTLIYKAKLVQTTGLDWKQVKLALSTSTPSQKNEAPTLKTWFLSYVDPLATANSDRSVEGMLQGKAAGLQEVVVIGYGTRRTEDIENDDIRIRGNSSIKQAPEPLLVVDGKIMSRAAFSKIDASAVKKVEVLKDPEAIGLYGSRAANGVMIVTLKNGLSDYVTESDNELNLVYNIDLPYDVPGNGKAQQVIIKETPVDALYKFYSIPRLDKDVYLMANLPNWEALNLLPGEANIIFEGTYIGKSFIDPHSTHDTLKLTLGRDKRIVISKEKLKDFSSTKFLGTNKKQAFTYEITVKNNKKEAIDMDVKDQVPMSDNKDIDVELVDIAGAAHDRETGMLNWTIHLQPGEMKKIRISYTVKYPKDKWLNL